MSYSNSRSYRRKSKRQDPLAMVLAVVSVIGLPVLGFAAYKLLTRPPTTIVTYEHVQAEPIKVEKFHPEPPKKDPRAVAAASRGRDSAFGPGSGSAGGRVTSVPDAVDQIAQQLAKAVTDTTTHQVLLVWLFDQSASNDHVRSEVAGRLDTLYQELATAAQKAAGDKPADGKSPAVLSVVGAFGPSVEFLTKEPTADAAAIQRAAEGIKSNSSHVENTFGAVQAALEKFSSYRVKGRYVSLVIVSDEVADDEQKIDDVLPKLKRYAIPVYCIGVQASFGRIDGPNQTSEGRGADAKEVRVRQGPDSRFPEWIQLQYPDGRDASSLAVDSELGPYTLSRLCLETDGEYFALPQIGGGFGMNDAGFGRRNRRSEPMMTSTSALPRKYVPVYLPESEIQGQLTTNKAKQALVQAAKLPPAEVLSNPTTLFTNGDDVERTRALDKAQKPAARIQPGIDAYYNALKPGDADERKLAAEPRWQAGYDLAYGRAMAAKARADGYMSQLAVMKGGPKRKDPKPVQLLLEPTDDPSGNSVVDKLASKARVLLNRVKDEHPGTPWAASAERELQMPLGWKWIEQ
ncbi:MAG TPA: hypothetical protein VIK18_26920 [Pirellulales bacterium]